MKKEVWWMEAKKTLSRKEWLEERRGHIGASDVPAILGISPHATALDVWFSKVHGEQDNDNRWLMFGRDMEGAIANMYAYDTKRNVNDLGPTSMVTHPDIPWLRSTLDRVVYRDSSMLGAPLEIKNISDIRAKKSDYEIEPPIHHQVQLQVQMACFPALWGGLAALFQPLQLVKKDLDFRPQLFNAIYPQLEEFWKCVKDKSPPAPQDHRDLDAVKKIYNKQTDKTVVLNSGILILVKKKQDFARDKTYSENQIKEIDARIRYEMKDASWGSLADGRFVHIKKIDRKESTRTIPASSYSRIFIKDKKND